MPNRSETPLPLKKHLDGSVEGVYEGVLTPIWPVVYLDTIHFALFVFRLAREIIEIESPLCSVYSVWWYIEVKKIIKTTTTTTHTHTPHSPILCITLSKKCQNTLR